MSNLDPKKVWSYDERVWACARIAELEAENDELKERVAMLDVTAVYKSLGEMGYIEQVDRLTARITNLEAANRGWCEQYSHELNENIALQSRIAELEAELEHVIEVGNYGWDVIRKYGWEEKEINWWNTASDKAYKCLRKGK